MGLTVPGTSPGGSSVASAVTATPAGSLAGTTVEAQLYELDTEKQPVDSDLTAIAALSTSSFGRALLELANAAALRTTAGLVLGTDIYSKAAVDAGFQPLDSDLTAIAALSTTPFGRSLLEAANAAAARTLLGVSSVAVGRALASGVTFGSVPGAQGAAVGGAQVQTAGRLMYAPWLVKTDITLDRLAIEVTTAVAASNARLGIYNADTSWQPTTLVLDAGTVSCATTGIKTLTINQALPAGRYLAVHNVDTAGISLRTIVASHEMTGIDMSTSSFQNTAFWYVASAYAAFAGSGVAWTSYLASTNQGQQHNILARVSAP